MTPGALDKSGFFQALFDFSFRSFVTEKIIPVLYVLWLIVLALAALSLVVAGFNQGAAQGIVALVIGAPLTIVIGAIYGRVLLEVLIVVFRIADYTKEIADQGRPRL